MPKGAHQTISRGSGFRIVLFSGLAAVVLILGINSYDSGLLKGPILALTACLLVIGVLAEGLRRGRITVHHTAADLPVAGLALLSLGWVFLSPVASLAGQTAIRTFSCVVLFFAGTNFFETRAHVRTLLRFLTWLTAAVAVFGLLQYFLADHVALEFYLGPERRIGSTLGSPAFLGGFLVLVFPVLLGAALPTDQSPKARALQGVLLAALLIVLVLTRSRSSIIACGLSVALFFLLRIAQPRLRSLLFVLAALVVGGTLAFAFLPWASGWLAAVFDAGSGSTLARRFYFWEAGIRAFLASPLWGHGTGSFEPEMIRFRSPDYWIAGSEDVVPHAHNEIIETAVEFGLIGLFLAGWVFFTVLKSAFRQTTNGEGWRRSAATGLLCGLLGLAVDNLANVSLRQAPVAAAAWLCMGVVLSPVLGHERAGLRTVTARFPAWPGRALLAVCLLFLLWYIPRQIDVFIADQHTIRGLLSAGRGHGSQAVEEYRRAVARDPSAFLARSCLSSDLLKVQRSGEALTEAQALLSVYPDYPRAWMVTAVAMMSGGRLAEAKEAIRKEIVFRDHPEAFYVASAIHRTGKDTLAEREALLRLLDRCLAGKISLHAGYAATRLRELSISRDQLLQIRPVLEQLNAAFPSEQTVRANLTLVNRQLGDSAAGADPAR